MQDCLPCQAARNAHAPVPLHPWLWPTKPWQRIHVDFADSFLGRMFLVVVDAHAKWPEVIPMSSTTTSTTINELRHLFTAYGIPKQLVSDNGLQFTSEEFSTFCKQNGVKHIRCTLYHPALNGLAERFVQTFKRAMKASSEDKTSFNQRLTNFLLTYRCTPHATTGEAPCQLFMGRKLRTRLNLMQPSSEERVQAKQAQQKYDHDKHAHPRELEIGQSVMAPNFLPGPDWVPGVVEGKCGPLSYVVKVGDGQTWMRHISRGNESPEEEVLVGYTPTTDIEMPAAATGICRTLTKRYKSDHRMLLRAGVTQFDTASHQNDTCNIDCYESIMHACNCVFCVGRSVIGYLIM